MKDVALLRAMPKWHAARGFGAFANDPTLTPIELTMLASWVDGGTPKGTPPGAVDRVPLPRARAVLPKGAVRAIVIGAKRDRAVSRPGPLWISGWSFTPGDPLITQALITSDAGPIGTWVAGDRTVLLPSRVGIRTAGAIKIILQRRPPTDFERPFTARASTLRLAVARARQLRRAWTETVTCGQLRTGR